MIGREEFLLAGEKLHVEMLETLRKWIINEKNNLDGYIANPQGHVLYNPYLVPDMEAMALRSQQLGGVIEALTIMVGYKNGVNTKTQYDYMLDQIPEVIWSRLLEWMEKRYSNMMDVAEKQKVVVPVDEYSSMVSFNEEKFRAEMEIYGVTIDGVKVVIQYKKEQSAQG